MSNFGIDVGFNGSASGNQVYDNAIGIVADGTNSTVTNNTIYDNAIGIQVNRFSSGLNNFNISNNTIMQPSGTAINLFGNASNYDVRDNIFSLGATAIGLNAPASAQVGYKSDYNLFDLAPGATTAVWSGQAFTLDQMKTLLGLDINSFAANPQFANPAGADGIRGFVGGVDHGVDDDFSLLPGSPAIDRGDPSAAFWREPVGSFGDGSRVDIGAGGNSAKAAQSPSQIVQLLGQTGSQRYQVGQTLDDHFPYGRARGAKIRCCSSMSATARLSARSPGTCSRPTSSGFRATSITIPPATPSIRRRSMPRRRSSRPSRS